MISQYQTTGQGERTRSLIIAYLQQHPDQEFSRDDLVKHCDLTYEQVRRQSKNLCIDGEIKSRIEAGKRVYRIHKKTPMLTRIIVVALIPAWGVSLSLKSLGTGRHELQHCNADQYRTI